MTGETTLLELLELCHRYLFTSFTVQTKLNATTQGSTTNATGKPCPTLLRPWTDFPRVQQEAFDKLYDLVHPTDSAGQPKRLFLSRKYIEESQDVLEGKMMASEMSLRTFHFYTVDNVVVHSIKKICQDPTMNKQLGLGDGISFEDHTNALKDNAEDVQAHQAPVTPPENPPAVPPPKGADELCVYKHSDGAKSLLYVIEYKPPHKITREILRRGLHPMNILDEVVNIVDLPTDVDGAFQSWAEKLVAAAVVQTYKYMLESGVEYGCIVTGEAIVFLWVQENDSTTLYYHLSEPKEEVTGSQGEFLHPHTAVAQMLSLCVMGLRSTIRGPEWIRKAFEKTRTWKMDTEKILLACPSTDKSSPPVSPAYVPSPLPFHIKKASPYYTRQHLKRRAKNPRRGSDEGSHNKPHRRDSDDSDGTDDSHGPDGPSGPWVGPRKKADETPSKKPSKRSGAGSQPPNWQHYASKDHRSRPYCTQKCLLGLVEGSELDPSCPHVEAHRRSDGNVHALTKEQLCALFQDQLDLTMDYNCTNTELWGSRSMIFKVSLASYGYTLIAKGTRDVFIPDLQHEGEIYHRLRRLQGKSIPVYLGNIGLARPWYGMGGVRVIHMLLLAYGGTSVDANPRHGILAADVRRFVKDIRRFGVRHNDLEERNMLWSSELGRVMFIDFERSTVKTGDRVLAEISPNRQPQDGPEKATEVPSMAEQSLFEIYEDQALRLPLPPSIKEDATPTVTYMTGITKQTGSSIEGSPKKADTETHGKDTVVPTVAAPDPHDDVPLVAKEQKVEISDKENIRPNSVSSSNETVQLPLPFPSPKNHRVTFNQKSNVPSTADASCSAENHLLLHSSDVPPAEVDRQSALLMVVDD